jgi:hypothetical protein
MAGIASTTRGGVIACLGATRPGGEPLCVEQDIVNVGTSTLTSSSTGLGIKGNGVLGQGKSATPPGLATGIL